MLSVAQKPKLIKVVIKYTYRNKAYNHNLATLNLNVLTSFCFLQNQKVEYQFKEKHSFMFSENKWEIKIPSSA